MNHLSRRLSIRILNAASNPVCLRSLQRSFKTVIPSTIFVGRRSSRLNAFQGLVTENEVGLLLTRNQSSSSKSSSSSNTLATTSHKDFLGDVEGEGLAESVTETDTEKNNNNRQQQHGE